MSKRTIGFVLIGLGLVPVLIYAGLAVAFRAGLIGFGTVGGSFSWLVPVLGIGTAAALVGAGILIIGRALFPAAVGVLVGAVALAMLVAPLSMKRTAQSVPPIHDLTTDTLDPPAFVAILPLRADAPNPPAYDREQAPKQLAYYTELKPLVVEKPYDDVFALALNAVKGEGLDVVAAVPAEGRIEAVATTRWFGFKDDVVLRLRNAHDIATVIDVRSKSRVGGSDLGANAERIERILDRIETGAAT